MEVEEKKLRNFERLVISDAIKKRDEALKILEEEKKKRLSVLETKLNEKYDRKFIREVDKIVKNKNQRIADKLNQQKKELLSQREELINEIFSNITMRLDEYVKTNEYITNLKKEIDENLKGLSEDSVIIVNENDNLLKNLGYNVEVTSEKFYGGCKIIDRKNNIQIDLTNKSKLEKQRNDFLETYNLKI